MAGIKGADDAGRVIAGLIGYNPGPGIYSRLERAVQAMPENVRVQELPGLLKRYKEGVPGWELKATDLDSTIAGREVVPREELLSAVRERSPVYTTQEIRLEDPQPRHMPDEMRKAAMDVLRRTDYLGFDTAGQAAAAVREYPDWRNRWEVTDEEAAPLQAYREWYQGDYAKSPSPLGSDVSHGKTKYKQYGQGGADYAELLLTQPHVGGDYGSHWADEASNAVAHARYDTHGDALRINELQSDLGIYNRKMREQAQESRRLLEERGVPVGSLGMDTTLPFPLEDTWSDLLIKRLALEAARKGHRAIEVASPRAIADKVGGNIDNYEHFYGKVVPGALERLGRKMGGMRPDEASAAPVLSANETPQYATHQQLRDQFREATGDDQPGPNFWRLYSGMRYDSLTPPEQAITYDRFGGSHPVSQVEGGLPQEMYDYLHSLGLSPEEAQRITSKAMYLAPHNAREMHNYATQEQLQSVGSLTRQHAGEVGKRYIMSDEMRRRILTEGIGASVLAPLLMQEER